MTLEQPAATHPVRQQRRPLAEYGIVQIQTHTVWPFFEDVHLRRHSSFAQREIERDGILRRHGGVGIGAEEESWRSLRRYVEFVRKFRTQFRVGILAQKVGRRSLMGIRR